MFELTREDTRHHLNSALARVVASMLSLLLMIIADYHYCYRCSMMSMLDYARRDVIAQRVVTERHYCY